MSQYLKETRRYHLVVLFAALSFLLWLTPLQHYIPLGRFQHYSACILVFSLGYFVQASFSWKGLTNWGRFSYLATGLFFASVAVVFYQNPWLVDRAAVASEEKMETRHVMTIGYMSTSIILGIIWLKVAFDEMKEKRRRQAQEGENLTGSAAQELQ